MIEIVAVRFKPGGKQYYFDPGPLEITEGTSVIVETGKGPEYGVCVRRNTMVEEAAVVQPLRPVLRIATPEDRRQVEENRGKEGWAMKVAQQQIERHKLDMKLVSVEYSFDGSKIVFFFTSDGRVDFRALVKDLAGIFRARIELRQIGVRDEARMLGGLGICGKPFCCAQFLDEFQPVSIKMAKTQNLSLNPTKISGTCGRLMCCLKYEQDAYEDAVKRCPKQESFVECPDGVGNVSAVNLLREQVKVRLEDSTEQPKSYRVSEIRVVRSGKGKRPEGYVAPPREELEKLRYIPPEEERRPRMGDGRDLSAMLERYLGEGKDQAEEEQRRTQRRRRNGRGKGGKRPEGEGQQPQQAQAPRQNPPKAQNHAQPKERAGGPAGQQGQQQQRPPRPPRQPKSALPQAALGGSAAPQEGAAHKGDGQQRRRRPHHRRPRKPGEGGAAPKSE